MTELENALTKKAKELLLNGKAQRIVGWKRGEFFHDPSPATFETDESLSQFVYNDFCGANLSKYLIEINKKDGVSVVFLKPCDTYSFNELVKEHRMEKEKFIVIGTECHGKIDPYKLSLAGVDGVTGERLDGDKIVVDTLDGEKSFNRGEVLLERCLTCKSKKFAVSDETVVLREMDEKTDDRFSEVKKIEAMTEKERFSFWKKQLSKCIRCNACRNVCPACSCVKCVFDNADSGVAAKANADSFEEQLYHVIRAFHVAGRCTDCGECSRVCPERIPLHLLNRKFIKDIDAFYGDYQAGEAADGKTPLTEYSVNDLDPSLVTGGNK